MDNDDEECMKNFKEQIKNIVFSGFIRNPINVF